MICQNCGRDNNDSYKMCIYCGAQLNVNNTNQNAFTPQQNSLEDSGFSDSGFDGQNGYYQQNNGAYTQANQFSSPNDMQNINQNAYDYLNYDAAAQQVAEDEKKQKRNKLTVGIVIAAAIVIAVITAVVLIKTDVFSSDDETKKKTTQTVTQSETQTTQETTTTQTTTAAPSTTAAPQTDYAELTDITAYSKDDGVEIISSDSGIAGSDGILYYGCLRAYDTYSMISFNLQGNYDKLTAEWFIDSDYSNDSGDNKFIIYVDKKKVYTSDTISGGSLTKEISVDLDYAKMLTIIFTESSGAAVLGDILLSCSDVSKQQNLTSDCTYPVWLTDLEQTDSSGYISTYNYGKNNQNESINHCINGSVYDENASVEYSINGKYSKLKAKYCLISDSGDMETDCKVIIYADGKKVYSKSLSAGDESDDVSIDISKCKKLKITFTSGDGQGYLSNIILW